MQQVAEKYHVDAGFRRVVPEYVQKHTLYLTLDGKLVLLIGNQYLQVTADEARDILEHMIGLSSTFSNGGTQQ